MRRRAKKRSGGFAEKEMVLGSPGVFFFEAMRLLGKTLRREKKPIRGAGFLLRDVCRN
jgi:hypothetical protein